VSADHTPQPLFAHGIGSSQQSEPAGVSGVVIVDPLAEPIPEPAAPQADVANRAVPALEPPGRASRGLTIAFLALLALLALLGAGGTAASAVESLLANPTQSCGGG
jgi:hypothetical protein